MKHYNRAGLRRGAPPHTEPIYLPAGSGKFVHPHHSRHHDIPVIYTLELLPDLFSSSAFSAVPDEIQDLGGLTTDQTSSQAYSGAKAVSPDGFIVGGYSSGGAGNGSTAVIWSGDNWTTKTKLRNLGTINSATSAVYSISRGGAAMGGYTTDNNWQGHAVIWSGTHWSTLTVLNTLKSDGTGSGLVGAMSDDDSIAAGWSASDRSSMAATVWSGTDRSTVTPLGALKSDGSGSSRVNAISQDGLVAAGIPDSDTTTGQGVIWSGPDWSVKTALSGFDGPANSSVSALSGTGLVAGGRASVGNLPLTPRRGNTDGVFYPGQIHDE